MTKLSFWKQIKPQWLLLSVIIIIADQITKHFALQYLPYNQPKVILPIFNLTMGYNTGAAFNFLNDGLGWQIIFFGAVAIIVSIIIVFWLYRVPQNKYWLSCALSFILGGAFGNLYDRIQLGYVIDFIQLHIGQYYFPTFNVADSAITVGAIMLLIDVFKNGKNSPS